MLKKAPLFVFFILIASTHYNPVNAEEKSRLTKSQITDWEARLELARTLSYLKRYDESIAEYKKLLQVNPNSTTTRIEMAKVLFYQEKDKEALDELSKVPNDEIDDAGWIVIADIHRKMKDYPKAEGIYNEILEKAPQDDKTRLKLAEMLSWEKRYLESIEQYLILLTHRPDDIQLRRRYAQVLSWMGNEQEAAKEWEKTLQ